MITDPEKDWPEYFTHENGNYINICMECKEQFRGHKRRVICRECMTDSKDKSLYDRLNADKDLMNEYYVNWNKSSKELDSLKKVYNDLAESHAKLVKENKDLQNLNKQWSKLLDPILDWGQSSESGIKLGESITSRVLDMAKDYKRMESELLKANNSIILLDSENISFHGKLSEIQSKYDVLEKMHNAIENAFLSTEEELLKSKELLNTCIDFVRAESLIIEIDEFLNKK